MTGQKGVKNVGYLRSRKKSTKAKKCRVDGCKNRLRKENKSGYCNFHISKTAKAKMRAIRAGKNHRENNIGFNINREIYSDFSDFCEQYGFSKKKKLELVIKEFLKKHDAILGQGDGGSK